jgi:atypical dual specificity phosphatase
MLRSRALVLGLALALPGVVGLPAARADSTTDSGLPPPAPKPKPADPNAEITAFLTAHPSLVLAPDANLSWITPRVLLGRRVADVGYDTLPRLGVGAVLSLQEEELDDAAWLDAHGIASRRIPVPDYGAPTPEQLGGAIAWMREQIAEGKTVYVHCRAGIGRSATVVAAFLASENGWSAEQAWDYLHGRRPIVDQTESQRAALEGWAKAEKARREREVQKDEAKPEKTGAEVADPLAAAVGAENARLIRERSRAVSESATTGFARELERVREKGADKAREEDRGR